MNSGKPVMLTKSDSMTKLSPNLPKNVKKTKIKEKLDESTGTQEIDKEASDAIVAQGKFLVTAKKDENKIDTAGTQEIQRLKASLPKDEKKEAFKNCLISNQYLMMHKINKIDDLSKYTSLELNIIRDMADYNEQDNPLIEPKIKESMMKEIFGENFYNTNIGDFQKEFNQLKVDEQKKQLIDVNKKVKTAIESNINGCKTNIDNIRKCFNMFENVYSQIMKGDGLEKLAEHRAVELCFSKFESVGFTNPTYNVVSMLSNCPTLQYLEDNLSCYKGIFEGYMLHELTHYTQYFLRFSGIHKSKLSDQAQKLVVKYENSSYDPKNVQFKNYLADPMEMGARATQILSQFEEKCGLEYGEFCFQDKGTDEARKEHAKKIVEKLDEYVQKNMEQSLCELLKVSAQVMGDFPAVLILLRYFFGTYGDASIDEMIINDAKLNSPLKQFKTDAEITKHLEECFEYLLEYIIPREDMRTIAQELGSNDKTFIETEKMISQETELQSQIAGYESQIQLYETLQEKMKQQDASICMPSIDCLSEQIKDLEDEQDVKEYKNLNKQLKEAQASNQDTKELSEQVKQYSTIPIVQSYIYLNKLINQSKLVDLKEQLKKVTVKNPQEAKKKIDEIKVLIQEFGNDVNKGWIEKFSKIINELVENAELKGMSFEDKQKYIKDNKLEVKNEDTLLPEIQRYQTAIRLFESINNNANAIYENRNCLKNVFDDDASSINAIEKESNALGWFKAINNVKNYTIQQKIDYLRENVLSDWKGCLQVEEVLNEYLNNASSKPDEEPELFNKVLKVFNDLYIDKKAETNTTILNNPNNRQKIAQYLTYYQNKLEQSKKDYNNAQDEAIKDRATQLEKQFNQTKPIAVLSLSTRDIISSNKTLIDTLSNIKNKTSDIMQERYNYERTINEGSDSHAIVNYRALLTNSFNDLNKQLKKLPISIQSQLKLYSNWAQRGLEKFQNWRNALAK